MQTSKNKCALVVCTVAAFLLPQLAGAATRTIQFAGILGGDSSLHTTANEMMWGHCAVTIVNTGSQDQRIERIEMLPYIQGNQRTAGFVFGDDIQTMLTRPDGPMIMGSGTGSCIGTDLKPGAICVARMATNTMPNDVKYTVCAGRITVRDANAADPPGSMTAAGTISMNQEALVLGGTLSGAFYQSGSHVSDINSPALRLHPDHTGLIGWDYSNPGTQVNAGVAAMNIYCSSACIRQASTGNNSAHLNNRECAELCGYGGDGGANLQVDLGNNGSTERYAWHPSGGFNITGIVTTSTTYGEGAKPNFDDAAHTAANPLPAVIQSANAHFAGGMVYEMLMGPVNMICSANTPFWENGGNEFIHPDGVDSHAIIYGQDTDAPPERLFCSHRHAEEDLHMKVGSSSAFTINGGNPF